MERSRDFERFITFIDAIVAIAITLLVLPLVDIAGELNGGSVTDLVSDHSNEIWGFLLSFLVIARLWLSQHAVIRTVIAENAALTRLLLGWTLTIVVLPFPTALLAEPGAGDQAATKIFYIGTMAVSSALLAAICVVVGRDRSARDSDDKPDPTPLIQTTVAFVLALAISLTFPATSYYPLMLLMATDFPFRRLFSRAKAH
ncbi:hypothetical protein VV02_03530 [Luteipulveratus mongoliensis]|uniref:DUF1211 domain-containing protein n=1 Tax=Luteipulveratus mongoliensis TaxID=571913 RepID=A0A0K1JPR7_9MICO|nr:hypothetical protein VV02_03530 [Luteipulveratus mongoliensis]